MNYDTFTASTGYWLVPFSDMIDTATTTTTTGNISAAEAVICNYSSSTGFNSGSTITQSNRPPPAIKIPFNTIEISAISVHLTSNSTDPGWGVGNIVELSLFPFCDISLNGFPWDTVNNDFVKPIELGIFERTCSCRPVEPTLVGCEVAGGTRGAIAVAFKFKPPTSAPNGVLTNQPSISVALHYKILP